MTPGSTHIVRCPHCAEFGCYETINSGNNFGAKFYTDGKQVAAMMPQVPAVVECPGCNGLFWLDQQKHVGEFDACGCQDKTVDPAWMVAAKLREPIERQYLAWLDRLSAAQPVRERDLRMYAWWRSNDRYRVTDSVGPEDGPQDATSRETNMRALLALLARTSSHVATGEDQLMRAEIHRQLGEFDRGLAVLSLSTEAGLEAAVERLRSLCEAGDRQVRTLF